MERGLINGFVVPECGFAAHRMCSKSGGGCAGGPGDEDCVFGVNLCGQVSDLPAPLLVMKCAEELEASAEKYRNFHVDLYKIYRSTPAPEQFAELVESVTQDIHQVQWSKYPPNCIASLMKKFLKQLPDPVIPVQWYDRFIQSLCKSINLVPWIV